jgi:hypothetical protein
MVLKLVSLFFKKQLALSELAEGGKLRNGL